MKRTEPSSANEARASELDERLVSETKTNTDVVKDPEKEARYKRIKKVVKWGLAGIMCVSILGIGTVSGVFLKNPTIRRIAWNLLTHPNETITRDFKIDPTGHYKLENYFPPEKQKSLTVLLLGIDHDYGGKRTKDGRAIPITEPNSPKNPGRSDSIMLARFEFEDGAVSSINILSVPRDTRVTVPGMGIHKINAAHAYGGPELSMATVKNVFGVEPDYFVDLNFEGFQQVVDTIGGVDVNVHQQLDYDDNWGNLHIHLKPGRQHLNGYKAMGYVRIRHTDNDLMRAQRQHEFLEAMRDRVTSPDSFMRLPDVVSTITDNLKSNLTTDQLLTLLNVARKAPKENVRLETLPVIEGKTFVYIDRRKAASMVRKLFFKDAQVANTSGLEINVPDEGTPRPRKHRHHIRTTDTPSTSHAVEKPSSTETNNSDTQPNSTLAPPDAPSDKTGNTEKPEKAGGDDTGKQDSGAASDSGKPPAKSKDDSGTSSGTTSPVIRS